MKPVLFPAGRVVLDIIVDLLPLGLIPEDVLLIIALPDGYFAHILDHGMNTVYHGGFVCAHDCA